MNQGRNRVVAEDVRDILDTRLPWDELAGKTVLVTGASGFLPAYLVETLLHRNEVGPGPATRVVGLARDADKAAARFAHHAGRSDLEMIVQDVCDPPPADLRADVVIHAASQASPKYYGSDPVGTMRPNVVGTDHLLRLAVRSRSERFLFLSSSEVYGVVDPERNPIREDEAGRVDPRAVRSCYAEGKRAGETLCVSYHFQHGVPAMIVRPFHTYGPGLRRDDGRVYADFVNDVLSGRDIVLTSDGAARRAFCYAADATAGFFAALLKGEPGHAYNVGNDDCETSIYDLARMLVELYPEKGLKASRGAAPPGYIASAVARNCPDSSKARALGWAPRTGLAAGFRRTIESFE